MHSDCEIFKRANWPSVRFGGSFVRLTALPLQLSCLIRITSRTKRSPISPLIYPICAETRISLDHGIWGQQKCIARAPTFSLAFREREAHHATTNGVK